MDYPRIEWWIHTVAEISQGIGLLGAAIGLILNYLQLKSNNRQKAAEFIFSLNNNIYQNDKMNEMYFKIESNTFIFNDTKFNNIEDQKALTNLLDHFESIAKLYLLSNFKLNDLEYLAYYYLIVYKNKSVQNYITFLEKICADNGISALPYIDFNKVGQELKSIYYNEKKDKFLGKKDGEKKDAVSNKNIQQKNQNRNKGIPKQ